MQGCSIISNTYALRLSVSQFYIVIADVTLRAEDLDQDHLISYKFSEAAAPH